MACKKHNKKGMSKENPGYKPLLPPHFQLMKHKKKGGIHKKPRVQAHLPHPYNSHEFSVSFYCCRIYLKNMSRPVQRFH